MTSHFRLLLLTGLLFTLIATGCGDDDYRYFYEPDFSSVPELPDTTGHEAHTTESGLRWYVINEGEGEFQLEERSDEQPIVYLTSTTSDGHFIESSYADNRTDPIRIWFQEQPTGLVQGMRGMKINEYRVIVVPPMMGPVNVPWNNPYYPYRGTEIVYYVDLVDVQ